MSEESDTDRLYAFSEKEQRKIAIHAEAMRQAGTAMRPLQKWEDEERDQQQARILADAIKLVNEESRLEQEVTERQREEERVETIGTYLELRSKLLLLFGYTKLALAAIAVAILFVLLSTLLSIMQNASSAAVKPINTDGVLFWSTVGAYITIIVGGLRVYRLWYKDYIYADAHQVMRSRKGTWWLGISEIHIVIPMNAVGPCEVNPTLFQLFLRRVFHIDVSTVTIDTTAQKDAPFHDMGYVVEGHRLQEIIDAARLN